MYCVRCHFQIPYVSDPKREWRGTGETTKPTSVPRHPASPYELGWATTEFARP